MLVAIVLVATLGPSTEPDSRLIFPPHPKHNHGSCIVECPNGDLLACWYRGSGERSADDVAVLGARLRRGAKAWSEPFPMADVPGFPDTNPCMIVDPKGKLWLFWVTVQANRWETGLLRCKTSADFQRAFGPPKWKTETVVHLKPGTEFAATVTRDLDRQLRPTYDAADLAGKAALAEYRTRLYQQAQDKLTIRLGWMTRAHPIALPDGRLIVGLYSDGFDFSLMAITDDDGATWQVSEPLVGAGNVQPAMALRKDGTIVAYFRDNGPPPNRVIVSESRDRGMTWSAPRDTAIPDTGAGVDVLVLKSGTWALVNNDVETGRHRLSLHVSEDEGRTWRVARHLENDHPGPNAGGYSYPSLLQAKDGSLHASYTFNPGGRRRTELGRGESIKHVRFTEEWLMEGARAGPVVRTEFVYERAPIPSCHAATLEDTESGLVAAWFGGSNEGNQDVGIWVSRFDGEKWSAPAEAANGVQQDGSRHPTWNPVLNRALDGSLLLFYKVGPSPRQWWGEVKTSRDGGASWSPAARLKDGVLGPIKNKGVRLANGDLLCPSSEESVEPRGVWTVHMERLSKSGEWTRTGPLNDPAEFGLIQPAILSHPGGALQALCRSRQGKIVSLRSADGGKTWSKPEATNLANPNSGIDAVTLRDGRHLLVYNPVERGRTPLSVAVSEDGVRWTKVADLETEPGEYSYPAIVQGRDGLVHIAYTWRRERIKRVVFDLARNGPVRG